MRIHEFGTEHEKTVLLLHSACLSWRMFCPAVERLQTQYHLIIPALPAHDPDEKTPYTSVEAIAAELGGWLTQRGIGALWGLYGVSMGGAVALRLLADGKIPVRTCVLDAAITPYRAPRWLTRGFSLRNYLVIHFAQRHLALIRRAFPSQRFGQAVVEDVCTILGRMDRRDVWRVFDSCFHYPLPKQLCTAARVSYWYGEKEYSQRALTSVMCAVCCRRRCSSRFRTVRTRSLSPGSRRPLPRGWPRRSSGTRSISIKPAPCTGTSSCTGRWFLLFIVL